MKAAELYDRLEQDFKLSICTDDWYIEDKEYITDNFAARSMGLLTDSSDVIDYVYTAVFPSDEVLQKIISDKAKNSLLFIHHPLQWDMNKPVVFQAIPKDMLQTLKAMEVSIYNLHVPLDRNSAYSTTVNLARALNIIPLDEFYEYGGVNVGIIGRTDCRKLMELKLMFEAAVGHPVAEYNYGNDIIADHKVGLVAGGGNEKEIYDYLKAKGINTYITGIANKRNDYEPSVLAHAAARDNRINILAGTHYSTEKFACMKMVEYFRALGLPGEFIPDVPCMEDM